MYEDLMIITNIAHYRWVVSIDQYGDLPIFLCPYTGVHIRSKGYVAFHLKPDQSAWSFLGIASPPMPKTNPRLTAETEMLHHYIQLDIEPPAALPLPAIDSVESTDGLSKPSITTVDRKGNVYVPDETGHLVPTTNKLPQLSNDEPEAEQLLLPAPEVQMDIDSLQTNPETFLGSDVYKYFHNAGVEHGLVTQTLPSSKWEVVFDDGFV